MKAKILLILAIFFIVPIAFGQTLEDQFQAADAELNQVYKELRSQLNDKQKDELKKSQLAWIKEKDRLANQASTSDQRQQFLTQVTIERTQALRNAFAQDAPSSAPQNIQSKTAIESKSNGVIPFSNKDFGLSVTKSAKQLAEAGDSFAQAVAAMHYQFGWETEKNPELAAKYAIASANSGNPLGIFRLGALLREGVGVPKDEQKGLQLQASVFDNLYSAKDPYAITAAAIMIFQGKVVGQNVSQEKRQKDAVKMYRVAADMGFAAAQFNYAMALKDGTGITKNPELSEQYLEKAIAQSYPPANEIAIRTGRKIRGAENIQEGSVVEGLNMAGKRWAYEFLDSTANPTQNLASDSAGLIVYADERHVVREAMLQGSVDVGALTSKTELSFYDVKSGKLKALVSVPNSVFTVGSIQFAGREIFFIGTITPGKYRFVDYPMALVLVDIEKQKIERLPLVESDYWLALNNAVEITGDGSTITVKVDSEAKSEMGGAYLSPQPQKVAFKDVNLVLSRRARLNQELSQSDDGLVRHRELLTSDKSGLSYLGDSATSAIDSLKSRGEFVVALDNSSPGNPRILRAEKNGQLNLFDFNNLAVKSYFSKDKALFPRFYENGAISWISGDKLYFIHDSKKGEIVLPRAESGLYNDIAVPSDLSKLAEYHRRVSEAATSHHGGGVLPKFTFSEDKIGVRTKDDEFFVSEASFKDGFSPFVPSDGLINYLKKAKDADIESAKERPDTKWLKEAQNQSIYSRIFDWDLFTDTFVVNSGGIDYQRVEVGNGTLVGSSLSNARGDYAGITYSNESKGWRAYSYRNESHSGGASSCVMLERTNGDREEIRVFGELSENADPLTIKVLDEKVLVLFGAGDTVCLVEVDLALSQRSDKTKSRTIREWNFASRFGKALCNYKSGTLFIPTASGFEVWSVWQEKPTKRFDFILGEGGQYAVLLPNGVYGGSPGCETLLRLIVGVGMVDGTTIGPWRNRPAEVLKALGGDPAQIEILSKVTERWLKKLGNPERNPEPTAADLPTLDLSNDVPLWAKGESVDLQFTAKPGTAPVKEVIVRVNGVDQKRGSNAVAGNSEVNRSITLAEGQNWIEAVAIDEKGRSSNLVRFRTILREAAKPTKRYIIAIGVSKYRDSALNLEFAAKDATDLAAAIKESTKGETEVLLLTNEQATNDAPAKIREFLAAATENDEVVAFCAGHGVLDSNLDYVYASHDFDSANPSETGIKLDELVDAIGTSKSLKRLLLLDTCHSGQVGEKDEMLLAQMDTELPKGVRAVKQRGMSVKPVAGLSAEGQQRFIEEMFLLPGLHRGINIIGASGGAEFALESAQWNNGVFTASIIEALREKKADLNEDGRVSVGELRNYLAQRVSDLTKGAQKPSVVAAERDQDFDLIRAAYKRPPFAQGAAFNQSKPNNKTIPKSDKILDFEVALSKADAGDAYAQAVVSIYYGLGLGCDQDPAKSKDYVMLSAKQQNPLGIYRLAEMRESGEAMDQNTEQALQLMKKAKPGLQKLSTDPYALTALATIYERENPESPKIREVLTKASEMGYEPAQEKLTQLPTN